MDFNLNVSTLSLAEKDPIFQNLFSRNDFEIIDNDEFLKRISLLVDFSFDLRKKEGLEKSIPLLENFLKRDLTLFEKSLSHYFLANAYSNKKALELKSKPSTSRWLNSDIENEILNFRLSLKYIQNIKENNPDSKQIECPDIDDCNRRNCQIFTNLGNLMDNIGRIIEGIEYRDESLIIDPNHGMALGNKGLSYVWYARFLPDKSQQAIFYHEAHRLLKNALNCPLEYGAPEEFRNGIKSIEKILTMEYLNKNLGLNPPIRGSKSEIKYKKWCLNNHLFLNPLNDIGVYTIAIKDDLLMPVGAMRVDYGINCHTFFNQLKQEYVAARYLYYEGITENKTHFSDRDLVYGETFDRPLLSLASEKIKISFRLSYSIFDKIAFFLNYYFSLHLEEKEMKQIYFRSVWYETRKKNDEEKHILPIFLERNKNFPLIGLFWLSKDLYEKNTGFVDALEPDAKGWYDIRNSLEHKFFKITYFDSKIDPLSSVIGDINSPFMDSIQIVDFENKTLKLLKTARNALVYLVIAINYEEKLKEMIKNKS